ncbi:MAG: 8-oxo-dGTP diphosphatase [Planctomycetota bacterium]
MPYTPILATLGFVLSPDRQKVLMVHRCRKGQDLHEGKYNGLGGKLEPAEDIVSGMKRELQEEAHIKVLSLQLRGTLNWPGFGKNGEDWFGFIFRIDHWKGTVPESNEEGTLHWMEITRLPELPMWEGDRFFLPMVFDANPIPFHGVMPYSGGTPIRWEVSRGEDPKQVIEFLSE